MGDMRRTPAPNATAIARALGAVLGDLASLFAGLVLVFGVWCAATVAFDFAVPSTPRGADTPVSVYEADEYPFSVPEEGDSVARLHPRPVRLAAAGATISIPEAGLDSEPLVLGVGEMQLASGVGMLPGWGGSVSPLVVAGHRVTHSEPFASLPEVRAGARVLIRTPSSSSESSSRTWVFRLTTPGDFLRVDRSDTDVLTSKRARAADLILVTCAEFYHTDDRYVAYAELVAVREAPGG